MELNNWLNSQIPGIAQSIEDINKNYFFSEKTIGFAGKESINRALLYLRSSLFPGVYEKYPIDESKVNILIGNNIRSAALEINDLIEKAFVDKCSFSDKEQRGCTECMDKASEITINFIKKLPGIREILQTDIQSAYDGDPAAMTTEEILLSYPSITAISIHRLAHVLYQFNVPIIPRIMSEYAHTVTGIDIHPGAKIGSSFFIDHGTGVVIGETCTIGSNVKLYQGVTLGAKSFSLDINGNPVKSIKRHPDIEDNVVIYAGATILGGDVVIGHDSVIGGNVWLTNSVPPYSIVYNSQPLPLVKNGNKDV